MQKGHHHGAPLTANRTMHKIEPLIVILSPEHGLIEAQIKKSALLHGFDRYTVRELEPNDGLRFQRFEICAVQNTDGQPSPCEPHSTACQSPDGNRKT